MSKTKRLLEDLEEAEQHIPTQFESFPSGFTEIAFNNLNLERIFFRHKNADSNEICYQENVKQIIAITYKIGKGFSRALLNLTRDSASDLELKVAFNFTNDSANDIGKLINAFIELFDTQKQLESIELVITTDNHIKLLQFDNQLMLSSMNLSQTADGLTEDKVIFDRTGKPRPNYRNHELICFFSGESKSVAEQVYNQLKNAKNAKTIILNRTDVTKQLINACSQLKLSPLLHSETTEHRQLTYEQYLLDSIRSLMEYIVSCFLHSYFDVKANDTLEKYDYDDLVNLHSSIFDYSDAIDEFFEFVQDYATFISLPLNERPEVYAEVEGCWNCAFEQLTDESLDLEDLRLSVLEERYDNDLDDGECEPVFGPKSEEVYDRAFEDLCQDLRENLLEVLSEIQSISDVLTELIYHKKLYNVGPQLS